jgi:hypothetical protein
MPVNGGQEESNGGAQDPVWRTLISIADINPRTAGFAFFGFVLLALGQQYKENVLFWVIVLVVFSPVLIASAKYARDILFNPRGDAR